LLFEHKPGVVRRVTKEHLASKIQVFLSRMPQDYWVTGDESDRIAKTVIYSAKLLAEIPPAVLMKSEPGLAFHRVPFDANDFDFFSMPVFEEMLSRCSNPEALCAFIGSIFVPRADRQQYLWIYGEGENGKSSLMRFLGRLLGPAYHADEVPQGHYDKYWTSAFVGKRLVAFPDCNSPCFPRSAKFKGLTGSDAIRIEGKYDKAFSTTLDCKFVFLSNEELIISDEKADTRRAIYVKMGAIKGRPDPKYEEKLWAEAEQIVAYCLDIYRKYCPNNEQVPVQNPIEITSILDEQMIALVESGFDFGPSDTCRRIDFVQRLRSLGIKNPREVAKIKRFLFAKMGVEEDRKTIDMGTREKMYVGLKLKENRIYSVPADGLS
jgi:hypothetical protein